MGKMYNGFDPYDALISLDKRLKEMEQKHNAMANDYMLTQRDLDIALVSLNSLQKAHLTLSELVSLQFLK
jgi:hypothetical protein